MPRITPTVFHFKICYLFSAQVAEDSPLKPVRKKRRQAAVIDSDSDSDNGNPTSTISRPPTSTSRLNSNVIDSDSDLEILDEDWRNPTLVPTSSMAVIESSSDDNSNQDDLSSKAQSSSSFKLSHRKLCVSDSFKVPKLPRRKPKTRSSKSRSKPTTRLHSNYDNGTNNRSVSSRSRRIPVAIEEEIIGEFQYSSGEEDEVGENVLNGIIDCIIHQ